MFDRVLVPLDGSKLAEQALPYARAFARGFKSRIALLRVCEPVNPDLAAPIHGHTYEQAGASGLTYPVEAPEVTHIQYLDQMLASMRTAAQDYLERVAAPLRDDGIAVTCTVHEGSPAPQIVDEAEKESNTVIAMSTHGRSGIARWALGSVMDKVLHSTTNPLLTIGAGEGAHPGREAKLGRVIAPLDGSALAEESLPAVIALARGLNLGVCLVRVNSLTTMYAEYISTSYEPLITEVDAEAQAYLDKVADRLRSEGVSAVEQRLRHGGPAQGIMDAVGESEGGLVVMTTHGRTGLSHWMVGSVTDKVVRQCDVPVMVVRPGEEALGNA